MDKSFWQAIVDNDYAVPSGPSVAALTSELLAALGSPDFALRDVYAYPILEHWLNRDLYSHDELRAMIAQLTSNLSMGLGESGSDSAFLRAFSALMLAEIVYYDLHKPFLERDEIRQLLEQALAYFTYEQDLRGYVSGPGWVHAVAHGADLLAVLARHRFLDATDLERILDALAEKVAPPVTHTYLYNEDQRMLRTVLDVLNRNLLTVTTLTAWLDRLTHRDGREIGIAFLFEENSIVITSETNVYVLHNTKQFLHGLYFHLLNDEQPPAVANELLPVLAAALKPMDVF